LDVLANLFCLVERTQGKSLRLYYTMANKTRRKLSRYIQFANKFRKEHKGEYSFTEMGKHAGEAWRQQKKVGGNADYQQQQQMEGGNADYQQQQQQQGVTGGGRRKKRNRNKTSKRRR